MKYKFLNYAFICTAILGLGVPTSFRQTNHIEVKAEESGVIVNDSDVTAMVSDFNTKNTFVMFNIPANGQEAYDDGTHRFWEEDGVSVLTKVASDGTKTPIKANLCKASATTYYFDFSWPNPYEVLPGESIIANGTLTRRETGETITFNNVILKHFADGSWGKSETVFDFKAGEVYTTSYSRTNAFLQLNRAISGPFVGVWSTNAFLKGDVKVIRANGTEETYVAGLTANNSKVLSVIFSNIDTNRIYTLPEPGDRFVIENGTFTNNMDGVLTTIKIAFASAIWNGETWIDASTPVEGEYSYDVYDITNVRTSAGGSVDTNNRYYYINLYFPHDNVPYLAGWDKQPMFMPSAATITPKGSSESIKRGVYLLKEFEDRYGILIAEGSGYSWAHSADTWYEFQEGDKVVFDGEFSKTVDGKKYSITLNSIELEYKNGEFKANVDMSEKAKTFLDKLESTFVDTPEYRQFINDAITLVSGLNSEQIAKLDEDKIHLLSTQAKQLKEADYAKEGKEIRTVTINEVDATSRNYDNVTGCAFYHNAIDIGENFDSVWTANYKGVLDSYIVKANGEKSYLNSALVLHKTEKEEYIGIFIFVTWAGTYVPFDTGDRYVVTDTAYYVQDKENENLIYKVEFKGGDFTYTGKYTGPNDDPSKPSETSHYGNWIDTKTVPHLATFANMLKGLDDVSLDPAYKAKIDDVKAYYDNLSDDEKVYYHDFLLSEIDAKYAAYQALVDKDSADQVVALIDSIGEVTLTDSCKAKIDAAREAYEALNTNASNNVPSDKLQALIDAENAYQALVYRKEADDVIALINAIGEVTQNSEDAINAARNAYDSASHEAQDLISEEIYKILTDAEAKFKTYQAVSEFKRLVSTLNDSSTMNQIYSVLMQAKSVYALIEDKSLVADEYATLQIYIKKYNDYINKINREHQKSGELATSIIYRGTLEAK